LCTVLTYNFLLYPRQWFPTIVMSTSVCLSMRMFPNHTALSLPNCLCMLPMAMAQSFSGGVTKSQWEEAVLGFSFPLTMHNIWDPRKNGWTDRESRCRLGWWVGLGWGTVCYVGGDNPRRGRQFWGNEPDKPNTPNNSELDWSMQLHMTRGAWLQALDKSIIGRKVGCTSGLLDDMVGHIAVRILLRTTNFA